MKIHLPRFAVFLLILPYGLIHQAQGADIFRSEAADGTVSYSSQALDKSYRVYLTDSAQKSRSMPVVQSSVLTRVSVSGGLLNSAIGLLAEQLAQKHQVDAALVKAVMAVESNSNPAAVSSKGASGLMQLMPATAAMYGVTNISDPAQNIEAGILHLKYLLKLHKGNIALTLAAYNAGEGAVAKNAHRIPPYRETMLYVPAVLARMQLARNLAAR